MADGKITGGNAADFIDSSNLGKSGRDAKNRQQASLQAYEQNLKKRLLKYKKYAEDEAKLKEELAKRVEKYTEKLRKENFAQTKARLEDEYKYAITLQEKLANKAKRTAISLGQNTLRIVGNSVQGIDKYLGAYADYMTGIEARLQGTGNSFSNITQTISGRIGASQYVKQTQVLQNLNELVKAGIGYNVELRAFLETVKDSIATTFSAFDSNLLRIIRLQQADSTAARLGIEATLTRFLNTYFKDTSYLTDVASTVRSNLFEAESQLGRNGSTAFDYVAQKWLGSLYSVGVSSGTISSLSQGLGFLGSGNISALSGNDALQRLLVAASSASGLNYGSLLTGGVNAQQANQLLQGIISVMANIAQSSNQVVKSQYANLFGISISDMTAVLNLTDRVESIANSVLDYEGALSETEAQIQMIPSRMMLKTRIDNLFDNVMTKMGTNIANNAVEYTTWILADMVQKSGVDLSTTVLGTKVDPLAVIKGGIAGLNIIAEMGTIFAGLSGNNQLSLKNWGQTEVLHKGWGFTGLNFKTSGVSETTGAQMFAGNTESAFYRQATLGAAESAEKLGMQQEDIVQIIRDNIAVDVHDILNLLRDGLTIKNYGLTGVPGQTIGG